MRVNVAMAKIPADAAERIINLRGRLGLNQTELARLLGVSNVTVNRWEHGHTTPAAGAWSRILAAEEHGLAALPPATDPPATSAAASYLPPRATAFVGRRRELRELGRLVRDHRLVSIVGPGGIGKTRLALELVAGSDLARDVSVFVDLAAISTGEAVPASIASALQLPQDDATPPLTRILHRWGSSSGVVVLDNCEHVLAGARQAAAALLAGGPGLRILATSREPLGVHDEVVWQTPPLTTSAATGSGDSPDPMMSEAVQLFLARVAERQPSWTPGADTLVTVAELCRHLDGLPLAIELAAARMSVVTPAELLGRLDRRLTLLSSSDEAGPTRHRALDATIAWSHDLLPEPDRRVFRRLGLFPATFDLTEAEHACRDEALPALERLVRQSLVALVPAARVGLPNRYRLLDSIRLFARDRLRDAGEEHETLRSLADHLIATVGTRGVGPGASCVPASHERLTWRVDNAQAVLIGLLEIQDKGRALELAAVADRAWSRVGRSSEALGYLEGALTLPGEVAPERTIRAQISASWLHLRVGDSDRAGAYARQATALARETGDPAGLASALDAAGRVHLAGSRFAAARATFEESLATWRRVPEPGDGALHGMISTLLDLGHACKWMRAFDDGITAYEEARRLAVRLGDRTRESSILNNVGDLLGLAGRPREAVPYLEAAIQIARELDLRDLIPPRLANLAELHVMLGEPTKAIRVGEEAIATVRDVDDRDDVADTLYVLGAAYHAARDDNAALRRFREALAIYDRVGNASSTAMTVEAMAACLVATGSAETAARWLGFGAAARGRLDVDPYPVPELAPAVARCRRRLSGELFQRAWDAGAAASADRIVMEALHITAALGPAARRPSGTDSSGLTARQSEVLRLVADGRTNGEIADALGISDRTVERHLAMIFAATGTDRRAAAVAHAMKNGWLVTGGGRPGGGAV